VTSSQVSQTANPAIARAMASVAAAAPHAQADPARPIYHFLPPANWMNDPNGPIFHNGYFHLFYQHNPYGDDWGNMHWGHTRSQDLVHWEHLPIALGPSVDQGEGHVFSGCARVNAEGIPLLFYTSVKTETDGFRADNEQWAAIPADADWINWKKHPANPILVAATPGGPKFERDWRDPFIFTAADRTFLVLGAEYDNTAAIPLYEAEDGSLLRWRYQGLLYQEERRQGRFLECPNFTRIPASGPGGRPKWMLIVSPYGVLEYLTGDFDVANLTFTPERHGVLDPGHGDVPNFYASNLVEDEAGNCILLGWVRGFQAGHGWNGCLALPRRLTVGGDGWPRQAPLPALTQLRGRHWGIPAQLLTGESHVLRDVAGDALELQARISLSTAAAAGLRVRASASGEEGVEIRFDGVALYVAGTVAALPAGRREISLRLFLDKSVLEVFADDDRIAVTRIISPPAEHVAIALFAEGGTARFDTLDSWQMKSIW
jgi:sucrose-6-phosphate hydrolase SacC (GH32 family)